MSAARMLAEPIGQRPVVVAATPDDDADGDALALGVALARALDAGVVVAADGSWHPASSRATLRRFQHLRTAMAPQLAVSFAAGAAPRGLPGLALEVDAQLLVLARDYAQRAAAPLPGDGSAAAVLGAPCALAIAARARATGPPRRIGVAWNATPEAYDALDWAVAVGVRTGATVRTVRTGAMVRTVRTAAPPAEQEPRPSRALRRLLLPGRARATGEAEAARRLSVLNHTLAQAGDWLDLLDLLVLPAVGGRPPGRAPMSGLLATILREVPCAVVVLPAALRACPLDSGLSAARTGR